MFVFSIPLYGINIHNIIHKLIHLSVTFITTANKSSRSTIPQSRLTSQQPNTTTTEAMRVVICWSRIIFMYHLHRRALNWWNDCQRDGVNGNILNCITNSTLNRSKKATSLGKNQNQLSLWGCTYSFLFNNNTGWNNSTRWKFTKISISTG